MFICFYWRNFIKNPKSFSRTFNKHAFSRLIRGEFSQIFSVFQFSHFDLIQNQIKIFLQTSAIKDSHQESFLTFPFI